MKKTKKPASRSASQPSEKKTGAVKISESQLKQAAGGQAAYVHKHLAGVKYEG